MKLYNGDCLEIMKLIPDKSIDAIITDPPYGTTSCKWDSVIPFEPMWTQLNRIIKDNGAMVFFGSEPFSSMLVSSNVKNYKHRFLWEKEKCGNFLVARYGPLKYTEDILVFCKKGKVNYYPIMRKGSKKAKWVMEKIGRTQKRTEFLNRVRPGMKHNLLEIKNNSGKQRFPKDILTIKTHKNRVHPTQKPVALLEYLVKTYTNENEIVLDFTMGSGSTGVACCNTNRDFIGIELDKEYFKIAEQRIKNEL
jgi:site-specific DNA-methyltransferase (adenine-specific)